MTREEFARIFLSGALCGALIALLCGCSSRRTVVSSSERYTADSLAMGSQFVLDSVWRDSCTIVQTIIEFETENRPRVWAHVLADAMASSETGKQQAEQTGAESALTEKADGAGSASGFQSPVSNRIKRIVRTEVRRGAAGEVHAERSDSTVNVKELLENSTSNEQTYNRIHDIFLLPLFLIFLISFLLFIWVIRRKAGP